MSRYTPSPLGTLANEQAAVAKINENLTNIATAMEGKLSRTGTNVPDHMERDLDMNSNHVINVADPVADGDAVNLRTLRSVVGTGGGGGGEGGVSDHGLLTGLADDDHPQYFNQGRGDARYVRVENINTVVDGRIGLAPVNALADVQVSNPVIGEVLKWNGTQFVNAPDATSGGAGATNLSASATSTSVVVASDTGTDATITGATGSSAGIMTAADKTKLDGIPANATANSSDNTLLNRSNHIGTQTASTISDFTESVQDVMASTIVAGSNISVTYNDALNTLTIASTGGSGSVAQLDDVGDVTLGAFPAAPTRQFLGRDWTDPSFQWRNYALTGYDLADFDLYSQDLADDLEPFTGKVPVWNTTTNKWEAKFPNGIWEDFTNTTLNLNHNFRNKIVRATNNAGLAVTLRSDADAPRWPIGDTCWFYLDNPSSGALSFVAGSGATVEAPGGTLSFTTRYTLVEVNKRAANTYTVRAIGVGSAGGATITVADEGTNITASATRLNFVGAGVSATQAGGDVTITIPGGAGGGVDDLPFGTIAGTSPNYTSTIAGVTALATGDVFLCQFPTAVPTKTPTLNINSLGARNITRTNGVSLMANDIPAWHMALLSFDGARFILLNPASIWVSGGGATLNYGTIMSPPAAAGDTQIRIDSGRASSADASAPTGYTYLDRLATISIVHNNSAGYQQFLNNDSGGRTSVPAIYMANFHNGYGDMPGVSVHNGVGKHAGAASVTTSWLGNNSTVLYDGEAGATTDKVNLYGGELHLSDNNHPNVNAIGVVIDHDRQNTTATLRNFWAGIRLQSTGTQSSDVAFNVFGPWKVGLDFSGTTFDAKRVAVALKATDRIYFNVPSTAPPEWFSGQATAIPDTYVTFNGSQFQWFQAGTLLHDASVSGVNSYVPFRVYPNGSTLTFDASSATQTNVNTRFDVRANGTTAGLSVQTGVVFLGNLTGPIVPNLVGTVNFASPTISGTATAGASGSLPATVQGYINITIDGTARRIPFYNP